MTPATSGPTLSTSPVHPCVSGLPFGNPRQCCSGAGRCGAELDSPAGWWHVLVRPRAYAAAHAGALRTRMRSTLFPRLAEVAEKPYGIALIELLVCMAAMSALQWNVAAATMSVVGVPCCSCSTRGSLTHSARIVAG